MINIKQTGSVATWVILFTTVLKR